jgi:hypothetical protein
MQDRATPALRWWRALVLAGVAFGLGLVAHLSAGGLVPGRTGLAILFGLTLTGCAAFLGRAASTLRIATLVVAGQAFIHTVLTASSGHAGDPHATAPPGTPIGDPVSLAGTGRSGSLHDIYERGSLARGAGGQLVVPDWAQHLVDDLTGPHAAMAVAHVVAAALVGLWLASGERALWALIRLSRHAVTSTVQQLSAALAALAPVPPVDAAQPRLDSGPARRLHSVLLASTHGRRGPPALLAA